MRTFVITGLLLLLISSPATALKLDLRQVQKRALEANLGLRAQVLETAGAVHAVSGGYGVYDPRLEAETVAGGIREKVNFSFLSANPVEKTDYREGRLSLLQKLPSGASLSLEYSTRRESSNNTTRLFEPSYDNEWQVALTQPLLRNFGRTATEQDLLFAVEDRRISFQQLRQQAFSVLVEARRYYFEVLRLRNELHYRTASVEVAKRLLKENRAKVEAGVLPSVEILQAEVGVQLRKRQKLEVGRLYENALDRLRSLLDYFGPLEITGELGQAALDPEEGRAYTLALLKRPDLARLRSQVSRLELDQQLAQNQARPDLDLSARYGHAGLEREYGDSLDELAEDDLRRWEVGLTFSYPIGNRTAHYASRRAEILKQAGKARTRQQENEVRREVRAAIRLLEVSAEKIEVGRLATKLAEEELRTLFKRREVGLATTREVLEGEEDLAEAKSLYSDALAEYNVAVTEYYRVTGQLLEQEGIVFRKIEGSGRIAPSYE
ncbi:MAG: TolC family protein [Desulfuromonadales bacterium]|nr:TolC family protein [Desulfuromonadales bacterium]NIR32993.1 TolC family protein [Desulfuromonadales bacterium]NIS40331.1 TolC family protein [Desulfuromonadales bacterium]